MKNNTNPTKLCIITFTIALIIKECVSYKEMELFRFPSWEGDQILSQVPIRCNKHPATFDYSRMFHQQCYEKDITYTTQIYLGNKVYSVSLDFTSPVSWLKSIQCLEGECAASSSKKEIELRFRGSTNMVSILDESAGKVDAWVGGSSQQITGVMEDAKVEFWVRDNAKLKEFSKLILMGAYIQDEKDHIVLPETPFLLAKQLPASISEMTDGAISLKPASPFLLSLFAATNQNNDKSHSKPATTKDSSRSNQIVTVYLDEFNRHSISFGQLSTKYSTEGVKGIKWTPMNTAGQVKIEGVYLQMKAKGKAIPYGKGKNIDAIFTLSCSYLAFSSQMIAGILAFLKSHKHDCNVSTSNGFVECLSSKPASLYDLTLSLHFSAKDSILLHFSELIYPFSGKKSTLKIRKSWNESKMILGEPIFNRYLMILDYEEMKIGFSHKFSNKSDVYASFLIDLIRLFLAIILILLLMYLCIKPFNKLMKVLRKYNMPVSKKFRKSMKSYNPVGEEQQVSYYTGEQAIPKLEQQIPVQPTPIILQPL